jgi:hypothetical protein
MAVFKCLEDAVEFMQGHWMYEQGVPFQIVELDEL